MPRVNTTSPKVWDLVSDKKVWTSTYWPYANHARSAGGNPEENLWADKGPLDKFDSVLSKRGLNAGAKGFEKTPALNYLADPSAPSGFYIRKPTIREADAERTTGVDFTGNGKIGRNIKRDFLDEFGGFGTNGKKDGEEEKPEEEEEEEKEPEPEKELTKEEIAAAREQRKLARARKRKEKAQARARAKKEAAEKAAQEELERARMAAMIEHAKCDLEWLELEQCRS